MRASAIGLKEANRRANRRANKTARLETMTRVSWRFNLTTVIMYIYRTVGNRIENKVLFSTFESHNPIRTLYYDSRVTMIDITISLEYFEY